VTDDRYPSEALLARQPGRGKAEARMHGHHKNKKNETRNKEEARSKLIPRRRNFRFL
jgi:hypothetical protein